MPRNSNQKAHGHRPGQHRHRRSKRDSKVRPRTNGLQRESSSSSSSKERSSSSSSRHSRHSRRSRSRSAHSNEGDRRKKNWRGDSKFRNTNFRRRKRLTSEERREEEERQREGRLARARMLAILERDEDDIPKDEDEPLPPKPAPNPSSTVAPPPTAINKGDTVIPPSENKGTRLLETSAAVTRRLYWANWVESVTVQPIEAKPSSGEQPGVIPAVPVNVSSPTQPVPETILVSYSGYPFASYCFL